MKKLFMILPLVLVLCFAFGCEPRKERAEKPAVDIAAEEVAIRAVFVEQGKAGPAKDIELFMKYTAEDLFASGIGGKDAVREYYTEWFAKGRYFDNGKIEKIEVSSSGDMAYTACSWEIFDDEGSRGKNSNVLVWKKQTDGTWKQAAW